MEELLKKLGYSAEDIQKIIGGVKEEKIYITKEENIEQKYKRLQEQKENAEGQLLEAQKTIGELKQSGADGEKLQEIIKQHEETIKQLKADSENKIKGLTLDNAINSALSKSGAKHGELLAGKFDKSKLGIDEQGKVTGIDEQMKDIKEQYKDLFETTLAGVPPAAGSDSAEVNTYENLVSNADNMTAEQVAEQFIKI